MQQVEPLFWHGLASIALFSRSSCILMKTSTEHVYSVVVSFFSKVKSSSSYAKKTKWFNLISLRCHNIKFNSNFNSYMKHWKTDWYGKCL